MGLNGTAVIAGVAEHPAERHYSGPRHLVVEQWAELARLALADARHDAALAAIGAIRKATAPVVADILALDE